jgi:DNA-binding transcriptional regulator YhcF (GntR family)
MLSARNVETALRERILCAAYPRGDTLPSVRALAAELGASPSTVGRAVQELARQGDVFQPAARPVFLECNRVMATNAGRLPQRLAGRARRLLRVGWTLEGNPW